MADGTGYLSLDDALRPGLEGLRAAHRERRLRTVSSAPGRSFVSGGREFVNFSSNNYLSLSAHPSVVRAAAGAAERFGAGGTASRLIAGSLEPHRALEERLAAWKGKEAALVFPSGYQTNVGVIAALLEAGDCLVMDRLNHASLWDAARLSGARVFVYPHRDPAGLEKVLKRARGYRRRLVVTDSLFSMDGDIAPLGAIAELAGRYGAWTMIDEAHATGVFGPDGAGLASRDGVEDRIDIVMGTLSKALGAQGGYVCGSRVLVDHLVNRSRSFIYTTSLAPAAAGAAQAAIEVTVAEPDRRGSLVRRAARLRERLRALGWDTAGSDSQIVPVRVGPVGVTVALADRLFAAGVYAPAIRPPTVPEGECRLRFSLTYDHTDEDVERLLACMQEKAG